MPVAITLRRLLAGGTVVIGASCFELPERPPPETNESPVSHREASPFCISTYQQCYKNCALGEASCNADYDTGLCFPHPARIRECETNCVRMAACMPWDVGVETGLPCRWSSDRYECNFSLCSFASTACLDDCFELYMLTDLNAEYNQLTCIEACYDHYGCRPRPTDPCNPLPEGYIACSCPAEHGVECHPDDGQVCS